MIFIGTNDNNEESGVEIDEKMYSIMVSQNKLDYLDRWFNEYFPSNMTKLVVDDGDVLKPTIEEFRNKVINNFNK